MNPFQDFLTTLQVGQKEGTNCYDDSELITVTEMLNLLLRSAETGEPDCDLLYATLRMFLAKSDYEQLTLLLKTRLPTSHVEAIFGEEVSESECGVTMQTFMDMLDQARMSVAITPAGITIWEEERQIKGSVSLMTALDILEKKIEYEKAFEKHC